MKITLGRAIEGVNAVNWIPHGDEKLIAQLRPDMIVTTADAATAAVKRETRTRHAGALLNGSAFNEAAARLGLKGRI